MARRIWIDGVEVGDYLSHDDTSVRFRRADGGEGVASQKVAKLVVDGADEAVSDHCWVCDRWRLGLEAGIICLECWMDGVDEPKVSS